MKNVSQTDSGLLPQDRMIKFKTEGPHNSASDRGCRVGNYKAVIFIKPFGTSELPNCTRQDLAVTRRVDPSF